MAVKTAQCGGIEIDATLDNTAGVLGVSADLVYTTMPNQANSTNPTNPTTAEFNLLLGKLKTAGLMIAD